MSFILIMDNLPMDFKCKHDLRLHKFLMIILTCVSPSTSYCSSTNTTPASIATDCPTTSHDDYNQINGGSER